MIELAPLLSLGLLLVRPGLLMLAAPCFGGTFAPSHVKIGLTVLVAVTLVPSIVVPPIGGNGWLVLVVIREAAIGLALGLAMNAFMAGVDLAGQLSGFQLGLSYSATIDPQSGVRNNLVSVLYMNVTMVMFFLVNGHHAFLRALSASYVSMPIGLGQLGSSLGDSVVALLGLVFSLGVRLAAPLIFVLVVCEVALALVGRAAPALNPMVVGAPVRLLIGLVLLATMIPIVARAAVGAAGTIVQLGVQGALAFR